MHWRGYMFQNYIQTAIIFQLAQIHQVESSWLNIYLESKWNARDRFIANVSDWVLSNNCICPSPYTCDDDDADDDDDDDDARLTIFLEVDTSN